MRAIFQSLRARKPTRTVLPPTSAESNQNRLAILSAEWKQFPSKPISLLEIMREFITFNIFQWDGLIDFWLDGTRKPPGTELSKSTVRELQSLLVGLFGNQCEELGWEQAEGRLDSLKIILGTKRLPTAESVHHHLYELKMAVQDEIASRKFVMIENRKADFLEQKSLFGKQVSKAFPSAKEEVRSAGNCLAVDLNTAAVFHLMRVAELGMRALARNLKVKVKRNTIDSANWTEIIKNIGDATAERWKKLPKSKQGRRKAVEFLKFCEVAADELNVFKEIWRNNTMHAGLPYNEHEAHGVFIRVRDFMQRLSTKVSETND